MQAKDIYFVAGLDVAKVTQDMTQAQGLQLIKTLGLSIGRLAEVYLAAPSAEQIEAAKAIEAQVKSEALGSPQATINELIAQGKAKDVGSLPLKSHKAKGVK